MAHILIVDDEADVITYLSAMLTDAGHRVTTANNGAEAMDAVKADRPDLVSLDMSMPEKSGVRFYREMKEDADLAGVPIVIVTGVTNPWSGRGGEGTFEGFISSRKQVPPPEGFFEKPVKKDAYLAKVAELTGA
ncbi:MAG: response regulator [Planctomycetota bacterium]